MILIDPKVHRGSATSRHAKQDPPWIAPPPTAALEHTVLLALGAVVGAVQSVTPNCSVSAESGLRCFELLCSRPSQRLHTEAFLLSTRVKPPERSARLSALRSRWRCDGVLCAAENVLLLTCQFP